jgi:hypothetical protein
VAAVLDVDDATIDRKVVAAAETGKIISTLLERGDDETVALALYPIRFRAKRRIFLPGIR